MGKCQEEMRDVITVIVQLRLILRWRTAPKGGCMCFRRNADTRRIHCTNIPKALVCLMSSGRHAV